MRRSLYALFTSALLSAPLPLLAQSAPAPTSLISAGPDAGLVCAAGRIANAQRTVVSSVAHRAKMNRYDVKYYKLDIRLENTSLNVSGSVLMRVRVGGLALDSLAFELYQAPAGSSASTATLLIDSVVVNGRRSPGIRRVGNDATAALAQPAAAASLADARIYYHGAAPAVGTAAIGNGFNNRSRVRVNGIFSPTTLPGACRSRLRPTSGFRASRCSPIRPTRATCG